MVNCLICREPMKIVESENGKEEFFETYCCDKCKKRFLRKVTFKTQDGLVDEDTLEEVI